MRGKKRTTQEMIEYHTQLHNELVQKQKDANKRLQKKIDDNGKTLNALREQQKAGDLKLIAETLYQNGLSPSDLEELSLFAELRSYLNSKDMTIEDFMKQMLAENMRTSMTQP